MENIRIVSEINQLVKAQMWLDFTVEEFDGFHLIIAGTIDPTWHPCYMEIVFSEVNFMSVNSIWHSNTDKDVLHIETGEEYQAYRNRNAILDVYTLFRFISEDDNDFFVAAKEITYKLDKKAATAFKK